MEDGEVTIDGDAQNIATIIALVADSMKDRILDIKPDMYCSQKNYQAILEEAKNPSSTIELIDGVPHYCGYRLVPFNSWELE